jgi:AraC-like DNA-binding protein
MWAHHEVWLLLAAVLLVVLAIAVARDREATHRRYALFLIATVIGHLLGPILRDRGVPGIVVAAALLLETALPCAFWLLAKAHFDDEFELRPLPGGVLLVMFLAGAVPTLVPEARDPWWPLVPRLLALGIVAHAMISVHQGGQFDLVVSRLRARNTAVMLAGAYIFVELLAEVLLGRIVDPGTGASVHAVSSFVFAFAICTLCLRMEPDVLHLEPQKPEPEPLPLDPALAARLQHLIEVEQVFLQEGLTIAAIADRLSVHEYKVRQLINTQLGFKNFNAFLHHYRLREAGKLLRDPAKAHLGVAQIAYDVGYRSLGPFNKAFKELFGQTPTEFRASATPAVPSSAEPSSY